MQRLVTCCSPPEVQHSCPPVEPQVASRTVFKAYIQRARIKVGANNCICAGWLASVVPRRRCWHARRIHVRSETSFILILASRTFRTCGSRKPGNVLASSAEGGSTCRRREAWLECNRVVQCTMRYMFLVLRRFRPYCSFYEDIGGTARSPPLKRNPRSSELRLQRKRACCDHDNALRFDRSLLG